MKTSTKNIPEKINELKKILEKLKSNESDPAIRTFCSLCTDEKIFFKIAEDVFEKRPSLNEEHFIYLVFVSIQYLTNFSFDYIDLEHNKEKLSEKVREYLDKYLDNIQNLCEKLNVSTNIPERYAGLQIVSSMMYRELERPLTVVDIGCSLGLGLKVLNTKFFEKKIETHDDLLKYVRSKPTFNEIIGIDVQKSKFEWVLASYLPEHREKRETLKREYNDYFENNKSKIKLIQGDALNLEDNSMLSLGSADIVWISSACYQVEGDIKDVIKGIGWLLKGGGLWLYAYYRDSIDKKITPELNPYVVKGYFKDKNWGKRINKGLQEFEKSGLEILEAPNDNVPSIRPGRDYKKFLNILSQKRESLDRHLL